MNAGCVDVIKSTGRQTVRGAEKGLNRGLRISGCCWYGQVHV